MCCSLVCEDTIRYDGTSPDTSYITVRPGLLAWREDLSRLFCRECVILHDDTAERRHDSDRLFPFRGLLRTWAISWELLEFKTEW